MHTPVRHAVLLSLFAALSLGAAPGASATDTKWEKNHPRRDQVNDRLVNQNMRIKSQVKQGEISKAEGAALHQEVHAVRKEEQAMAAQHNGHITRAEQKTLNQQANAVSKDIRK